MSPEIQGQAQAVMTSKISVVHSDPDILGGVPVFVGTRVPIKTLLDYLEAGDSLNEFLDHFPSVSREQLLVGVDKMPTPQNFRLFACDRQFVYPNSRRNPRPCEL